MHSHVCRLCVCADTRLPHTCVGGVAICGVRFVLRVHPVGTNANACLDYSYPVTGDATTTDQVTIPATFLLTAAFSVGVRAVMRGIFYIPVYYIGMYYI